MDPVSQTPPVQPTPPPPVTPQKNNMLVMILVGIIILLIGLGGGYFFKSQMTTSSPMPTPQATNNAASSTITPTATPMQAKATWLTYTSTKLANTSFSAYSLQYPEEWTPLHKGDNLTDTYTLTKGSTEIKIYQAPMGGNGCVFEGDMPEGPMQDLRTTKYTEIMTASDLVLRRYLSTNPNNAKVVYSFCGTQTAKDWGTPTSVGAITYTSSATPSDTELMEMDSILKTLQLIK